MGVPAVSVSVVMAARAALISRRAEAALQHTSAGRLSLAEGLLISCMLNTDAGEQIRGLLLLQRPWPTSKKPSDRWCDYMAVTPRAALWPDMMQAPLIASYTRSALVTGRMWFSCKTASGSRGTFRAINNMDRIRLCGDPRAPIRSL